MATLVSFRVGKLEIKATDDEEITFRRASDYLKDLLVERNFDLVLDLRARLKAWLNRVRSAHIQSTCSSLEQDLFELLRSSLNSVLTEQRNVLVTSSNSVHILKAVSVLRRLYFQEGNDKNAIESLLLATFCEEKDKYIGELRTKLAKDIETLSTSCEEYFGYLFLTANQSKMILSVDSNTIFLDHLTLKFIDGFEVLTTSIDMSSAAAQVREVCITLAATISDISFGYDFLPYLQQILSSGLLRVCQRFWEACFSKASDQVKRGSPYYTELLNNLIQLFNELLKPMYLTILTSIRKMLLDDAKRFMLNHHEELNFTKLEQFINEHIQEIIQRTKQENAV